MSGTSEPICTLYRCTSERIDCHENPNFHEERTCSRSRSIDCYDPCRAFARCRTASSQRAGLCLRPGRPPRYSPPDASSAWVGKRVHGRQWSGPVLPLRCWWRLIQHHLECRIQAPIFSAVGVFFGLTLRWAVVAAPVIAHYEGLK